MEYIFLKTSQPVREEGTILIVSLVFTFIFLVTSVGLIGLAVAQNKLAVKKIAWERAFEIAEAGANYYRWHLAHDPEDFQDGTGIAGPYEHTYNDPYGGQIGTYSLNITPPSNCSNTVIIESTGWTVDEPNTERVVEARYGLPSLAEFGFLTNSNVWFGEDEELHGPVHANGGIRQDGENDGLMTSAKETYICGSEHGCASGGEVKDGVWGDGELQALWEYPVPAVDFNAITSDLSELRTMAQSSGVYLDSGLGYHIILRDDSSFDLYQVTQLRSNVSSYDGDAWVNDSQDIQNETFIANYPIATCSIIFVEDDLWVEGEINNQSLTVVSADLPDLPSTNTRIIINGDITYKNRNDYTSLSLIAQKDILVPLYAAPDELEINAVMLAQKGHVFRNYYTSSYNPYYKRDYIEIYGAIITNTSWTWTWVDGSNNVTSGYENTETIYDPNLKYNPPPGFPTETEYDFIRWEETTDK